MAISGSTRATASSAAAKPIVSVDMPSVSNAELREIALQPAADGHRGSSLHNGPGARHSSEVAPRWFVPPRDASHDPFVIVADDEEPTSASPHHEAPGSSLLGVTTATTLEIQRVSPTIGAEIKGLDISPAALRRHHRRDPRRVARAPRGVLPRSGPFARATGRVRRAVRRGDRGPSGRAVARGLQAGAADRQPQGSHQLLAYRRDVHVASADRFLAVRGDLARGRRRHHVGRTRVRPTTRSPSRCSACATTSSAIHYDPSYAEEIAQGAGQDWGAGRSRSCGPSSIRSCACTPRPDARTCS